MSYKTPRHRHLNCGYTVINRYRAGIKWHAKIRLYVQRELKPVIFRDLLVLDYSHGDIYVSRYMDILQTHRATPSGIWRCRSGHLPPARRGVPAYYVVRTGARQGVVLCTWHIVHRAQVVLMTDQGISKFSSLRTIKSGPCSNPTQLIRLNNLLRLDGTLQHLYIASDDQFYGGVLWDFLFVCFKDMAISKIQFFPLCKFVQEKPESLSNNRTGAFKYNSRKKNEKTRKV